MSLKLCCCLCCTPCSNYKALQNVWGECNEIYEITVKYFDPMLLTECINTISSGESRVLCVDCWIHIKDFHEFHLTVLKTRSSLEQTNIQKSPLHIKLEEEQVTVLLHDEYVATAGGELVEFKHVSIKNDQNPIGDDTELVSDDDDEDDECYKKPISELLKAQKSLKSSKEIQDKVTNLCNNLDNKSEPKSRRVRKSKETEKLAAINDGDETLAIKKPKDTENKTRLHPALEKFRKHNEFIAEWKSQLECDVCSEIFSNFDLLKRHFKDKHNARCYVKCCERTFYRRCALVEHIRLHINPEIHKCDICGKLSTSKFNLKLHKRTIHEVTQLTFECTVCQKIFKQKQNLERHLLTHVTGNKDFKCNECEKAYVLEVQLKAHIKLVHNDNRVCDQCGKTLHGIGALKKHLKEHEGIEKPKFPCDECGTELASSTNLKRHKAAYHNDGSTVYICSICGKVSGSERGLMNHRKFVHEIERKHKCPHCDKGFKRPKNLQEHIATHTGEALYQCQDCPKTFKINSKYHHHRKTAHPVEWEKGRKHRLEKLKIDFEQVTNQVIL
ncbi:transcription factor grauzone-like [Calliphora vicina]|uniref:transcription factor grauzone-like n=1 Tax=Calliphora vicina TaxID=7373 RepID=UPI00325B29B0